MASQLQSLITLQKNILNLTKNYLEKQGWLNNKPLDDEGFTPWYTYPAISFLKDIIQYDSKVLEYGSGYSTLFYNSKVKECVSIEHNSAWADNLLKTNSLYNIIISAQGDIAETNNDVLINKFNSLNFEQPLSANNNHNIEHGLLNMEFIGYATKICNKPKDYYDIIVIDGMARILSGFIASEMISENGIIILDNSDRWQYNSLQKYLIEHGFGRIDFWGPGPVNSYAWCTSFFSKRFHIVNNVIERVKGSGDLGW